MVSILNALSDSRLTDLLSKGSVGVLPTDTVYGLVCAATNRAAVERLYKIKLREHKPGTIIAADINQLVELGLKVRYLKAVDRFWPGAVTVIIPCGAELDYIDQGMRTIAVRLSADKTLNTLINKIGPILTSSANQPGEPPAANINEAQKYFGISIDFYVDGGDLSGKKPSTIIRVVDDAIEVLRHGAVKINEQTGEMLP